jgi:hypothetical protein
VTSESVSSLSVIETIVLARVDEVVKTAIKISRSSSALRKLLFHLFFIMFVEMDIYDQRSELGRVIYVFIEMLMLIWTFPGCLMCAQEYDK